MVHCRCRRPGGHKARQGIPGPSPRYIGKQPARTQHSLPLFFLLFNRRGTGGPSGSSRPSSGPRAGPWIGVVHGPEGANPSGRPWPFGRSAGSPPKKDPPNKGGPVLLVHFLLNSARSAISAPTDVSDEAFVMTKYSLNQLLGLKIEPDTCNLHHLTSSLPLAVAHLLPRTVQQS